MKRERYIAFAMVLWLMIIGTIVRVFGLSDFYFSPDDVMLLGVATGETFVDVWKASLKQTNAPLYYFPLHYMLKIGRNEVFLRGISIVPGVGSILVFFMLGRKANGAISGVTMAFLATFSFGAILLSQVIRNYSLMVFFLSCALWLYLSYLQDEKLKYLGGYVCFMILAISAHYPAVIPLVAMSTVLLVRMVVRRVRASEYGKVFLFHTPLVVIVGFFYFSHISGVLQNEYSKKFKETYLKPYFPETVPELIENIPDFFEYLFLPSMAPWMLILGVLGFVVLWKTRRREVAAIIFVTFAINFALTLAGIFPFGGARQSIYLFPVVGILIGASVQYAFDFVRDRCRPSEDSRMVELVERHRWRIAFAAAGVFVATTILIAVVFKRSDFLRRYPCSHGCSIKEFPLRRDNYNRMIDFLTNSLRPTDVILTNRQSSHYLLWLCGRQDMQYLSELLVRFRYRGYEAFSILPWKFENDERLREAFREVARYTTMRESSRVVLLNIGWEDPIHAVFSSDPFYRDAVNEELSVPGGFVYIMKGRAILEGSSK